MNNSTIEWCDDTLNLWWGCTEVHEGCDNCYARIFAHRYKHDVWGLDVPRREIMSWEHNLKKFNQQAKDSGQKRRVFIGSMMDIFEKPHALQEKATLKTYKTDFLRNKLFNELIPLYPNLEFLLLTKRPSNINKYIPEAWKINPPSNVYFGCSVVSQDTAKTLIPQLLQVNGNKFLSCEPLLEAIDIKQWLSQIDWIIVGGESGRKKRTFNPDWARQIYNDCKNENVAFFMKQWDKVKEVPEDLLIRQFHYQMAKDQEI